MKILGFIPFFLLLITVKAHSQFRTLQCKTPNGQFRGGKDRATCRLIIKDTEFEAPGRLSTPNEGCFTETVNNEERVYCAIVCPDAEAVANNGLTPRHRGCFNYYTYQLEQRDNDWFIWRSGACLNSTVEISAGCVFREPLKNIVKNDAELFKRLRARSRKSFV
uniref:Secreted protein n=1 Tax=Panagrellus redivivus TaxID=6233 RepID=A0A7E4VZH5_PANRE